MSDKRQLSADFVVRSLSVGNIVRFLGLTSDIKCRDRPTTTSPIYEPVSPLYAYVNPSFSSPLSPSITPSLFHSKLKTYLFGKSFPHRSFHHLLLNYERTNFSIVPRRFHRCSMINKSNYLPIIMLSTKPNANWSITSQHLITIGRFCFGQKISRLKRYYWTIKTDRRNHSIILIWHRH